MNLLFHIKAALVAFAITSLIYFVASNWGLRKELRMVEQQAEQQKKTLAQQAELLATMRADDARNRSLMAEQQQREQHLRQQGQGYQRKYRDAIKNDDCARRAAPGSVLDLLRGTGGGSAGADSSASS
ncbi:DUF2570 domain-containing protein [Serratia rubidaea]|uniref:hypothetical protein n=1 Tax=Serratia rubidaea TaxID=61652 RepID=UPI001F2D7A35|nr:hypothetical protein [Serratia rubidaea]UJD80101.1 DUF2570 domain-containing protein [Serratia rubidaea]UJD84657.1 DUF2570 domain-containing protein [Serratia rubidaea]